MIHARQSVRRGLTAQVPSPRRRRLRLRAAALLGLVMGLSSCGDDGIQPHNLRYGQLGSVRVSLEVPLRLGEGQLLQTLEWFSSGAWTLTEAISYKGIEGDEDVRKSPGDPAQFAYPYATLITEMYEGAGLKLFIPELSPDLLPECGQTRTRITLTIYDEPTEDQTTWIRCAEGSLANLTPAQAGPDAAASRVAEAAVHARRYALGENFASVFAGSVPFAALDRGNDLTAAERTPTVFTDSAAFRSFWGQIARGRPQPNVDFSTEMVVLGVVGQRQEAGDSVEVRRILPVDQGTLIEVWERIPGDYCSPVAETHVPYHVVVAPLTPRPLRFSDIRTAFVPCGG